ncbi:MAG: hypothetical protein ACXIVE_05895 [Salinarimonas sp.]
MVEVDWQKLEAGVDAVIASTFGESVRLSFLDGGFPDPARPLVDIRATLHTGGDDSRPAQDGLRYRTRLSAGQAELVINRASYTGPMPRQGDRVRANDRMGTPWFEVAAVSDRYSNLIVLSLNQA